jgi:precorrin-4/cobalt-precorrin-4 C11-methyltransferase
MYGAITEQMNELDSLEIEYEVIPGVSSVFASAAALKTELTLPGVSQSVILTRRAGRTPVPDGQNIADFAKHRATMGIFLSISDINGLVEELITGGYPKETAIAVVYRVTWDDEKIVRGSLEDIAGKVLDSQIKRQAMVIVGDAIAKVGDKSLLYDANFAHGYRKKEDKVRG